MSSEAPAVQAPDDDERTLHKLGYAQVLYREMGGFSNFAISFTIISILAGCLTSYYIAFQYGGPVAITWGWLLVGGFCIIVALAMGEIASTYPTAGGLYFWASKLGSPAWGWFTGWFNLVGQIAVTAAIDYGAAIFTTSLLNLWFSGIPFSRHAIFVTFTVIIFLHLMINLLGVKLLAGLNSISAWWHMAGVAIIVAILIIVPDHHQSASYVFTKTINNSGFSGHAWHSPVFWFVFGLGLLMAQYTITGYDASAHMSEETRNAARAAAWGIVMSVVVSVIFGFALLLAVTFAIPSTAGGLAAGTNIVTYIWQTSMSTRWAEFLLLIAVVAQFFCGTASVTSASRMMFAFSRDGAIPGHRWWRQVNRSRVPVYAVCAIAVLSWALMIPTYWNNGVGYLVGTSIAVIGLYIAFALPIILRWRAGESFERGPWSLGKHYKWIDVLAVAWIGLICVLFLMPIAPTGIPWKSGFNWNIVNYAPLTVGAALLLFGGWYVLSAHKWFKGPVRQGSEEELERIESDLDLPSLGHQPAQA
jgi:amino acid transporter